MLDQSKTIVVVPWHNKKQFDRFLQEWGIKSTHPNLWAQQDQHKEGCAAAKNRGVEGAISSGAETIVVLDDDCHPTDWNASYANRFERFIDDHLAALQPVRVPLFKKVTKPSSRGTPYFEHSVEMPVAASMGFWNHVGDYDACGQLIHGSTHPMEFHKGAVYGQYFPLCGMNLAFRASEWPWCKFINVERFDDIWQGFLWQRKAYADGKCFNLNGPTIKHSRQSNVWANLRAEAPNMETNERFWQVAATAPLSDYETFKQTVFEKLQLLTP